ncbi:MAG: ABC transporter ATP-binding protein [Anaerolineae bacterium]|nr:ABC transporter ATP-binding protein [Anaerolineae bacterium]
MPSTIIETRQVAKHFGGLRAVDGVDLQVAEGAMHSIIGPNGAGKTTLFNLISGYLKPTSGRVFLRGRDITGLPLHRMAHLGIGRSFQITNVFPNLTVFENVRLSAQALGADNYKVWSSARRFKRYEEQAAQAIQAVGLGEKAALPAAVLPHGDKRKLELAIILAGDPQVLLLDEPTAGMASEQVPALVEMIAAIRQAGNKTIILVEHNMSIVMNVSDRITVMHQGKLLAEGSPQQIAANEDVQRAYLGESHAEHS